MTTASVTTTVELNVGGMTCASCAARIEKKLNRMDGVAASVNFATEKARVLLASGVDVTDVVATVEATGYTAALPRAAAAASAEGTPGQEVDAQARVADGWRRRLLVSAAFTVPVVVMGWSRPCSSGAGSGPRCCWPPRSSAGAGGRFTGPRGRTHGTPQRRWTR